MLFDSHAHLDADRFDQDRDAGDQILELKSLSYEKDGEIYFKDISYNLNKGEKVLIVSKNSRAINLFYDCISGSLDQTSGTYNWGVTIGIFWDSIGANLFSRCFRIYLIILFV